MDTLELTIHLSPEDLEFAKEYARSHGLSVDELIDRYVKRLRIQKTNALHPDIERFSGIIPADIDAEKVYKEHLLKKHQ